MSTYRRAVIGIVAFVVVLAAVLPFLRGPDTVVFLSIVLAIEIVLATVSEAYLIFLNVTSKKRPRSWVLALLATTGGLAVAGGLLIFVVLIVNLLGYRLVPGLSLTLIGMAFVLQLASPILKAVVFALVDRRPDPDHLGQA